MIKGLKSFFFSHQKSFKNLTESTFIHLQFSLFRNVTNMSEDETSVHIVQSYI